LIQPPPHAVTSKSSINVTGVPQFMSRLRCHTIDAYFGHGMPTDRSAKEFESKALEKLGVIRAAGNDLTLTVPK
jgi:hypothetical protein